MGKVVTRSGGRLKVLNCNLHMFHILEIVQVLYSISWVRCASGNVYLLFILMCDFSKVKLFHVEFQIICGH